MHAEFFYHEAVGSVMQFHLLSAVARCPFPEVAELVIRVDYLLPESHRHNFAYSLCTP